MGSKYRNNLDEPNFIKQPKMIMMADTNWNDKKKNFKISKYVCDAVDGRIQT